MRSRQPRHNGVWAVGPQAQDTCAAHTQIAIKAFELSR
jgi:hypothetical protein